MDNKFIKIISIIFVCLVAIAGFSWFSEKMNNTKDAKLDKTSVNLSDFTKETVNKITIKKGDEEKNIIFRDNKWFIGEDEADEDKVKQFFEDFSGLKVKEMVSENDENWEKFEVTKDNGFQLIITQNGKDSIFFVGKKAALVGDFYMRKEGIKNVYLTSGELRNKLEWKAEDWKKPAEDKK